MRHITLASILFACALTSGAQTKNVNLNVDLTKSVAEADSRMYGVFFEDINFGADGGLYAELVKNRSFDFHSTSQAGLPWEEWKYATTIRASTAIPTMPASPVQVSSPVLVLTTRASVE